MIYTARHHARPIDLGADWDSAEWAGAEIARIDSFRPESSPLHRPHAAVRLAASKDGLHGIFQVRAELVRCTRTEYFDEVWKDSCVEFFVQPRREGGYFNFEFNCGGAFLCNYITDSRRTPEGGLACATPIPEELGRTIRVRSSLPRVVNPQRQEPADWTLSFFIPFALFTPYVGELSRRAGERWKCNFFKCAEEVSNPHWASWLPVDELNFHLPRCFGDLVFELPRESRES